MSIRARRLERGGTIGVVSPSWGGAGAFPHRVQRAVAQLASLGFQVTLAPHALNNTSFVSDTPENRASDIHAMFCDPDVGMILAAIGGDHACHVLPFLDFDLIRQHPKLFMGFSDITVLNVAIWKATGLVTFNGPALLTDFGEFPEMLPYTTDWFMRAACTAAPIGQITPSSHWTEEFQDWREKKDLERPRALEPSGGWTWLKAGVAEGMLVGGCLESLEHLRGTRYWPDWHDTILFIETSEAAPPPPVVDGMLMDYENMGVLSRIKGLLVGRPMRYSPRQRTQLHEVLLDRSKRFGFPIIADMDFGHTAPQFTLPIGCRAQIDTSSERFEILEAAVS